jgi:hypothetical protein
MQSCGRLLQAFFLHFVTLEQGYEIQQLQKSTGYLPKDIRDLEYSPFVNHRKIEVTFLQSWMESMTLIGARGEIAASRQCIVDWYCCCCFSLLSSFAFSRHFNFCGCRLLLIRIRAAHIVPYCIGEELPGYLFGPDQGLRLNRHR